jgi:MFS family permease
MRRLAAFGRADCEATREPFRLGAVFALVYFATAMYELPTQTLTVVLKERLGLSASRAATFFFLVSIPWFAKPLYGLLSDFVPIFHRRRKSYLIITMILATSAGFMLSFRKGMEYWSITPLYMTMALGIAFSDVMVNAIMVEVGRPRGLTGLFQSVQWGAAYAGIIVVGAIGGYFAESRNLRGAFALTAWSTLLSCVIATFFIHEPASFLDTHLRDNWLWLRKAFSTRSSWIVFAFILFWTFSPSFGPAFLYYQTDVLKFRQQFIGWLSSLSSAAAVVGAVLYAALSRRLPLTTLVIIAIGLGCLSTLAYLLYRDIPAQLL